MYAMGIDLGTTTVSVLLVDTDSGAPVGSRTVNHGAFLEGHIPQAKIQDPEKLAEIVWNTVLELVEEHGVPACIGLTGQMHGMLYVDAAGEAVSPLYTWQDGCGDLQMEDGRSYARVLREIGGAAATGYGLVSHFYLQHNHMIPQGAVKMTTISDYIGMKLCGKREPVIARDMAASWGCFDLEKGDFFREELVKLGVDISYLPQLLPEHTVMGTVTDKRMEGVPVVVSLGDNQASVLGSVQDLCETVLINIGTGNQVSVGTHEYHDCRGSIELRPCVGGTSLLVGAGLCGGRAYAMLEQFYREVSGSEEPMYGEMEEQARRFRAVYGAEAAWNVKTTFAGTRLDPRVRGSIRGIGVENFHPGAMTLGVLRGILGELHEMYLLMCEKTGKSATRLVGSGNGIRKNPLMQELAEEMFGMKLEIPACQEEAACGAALHAMAASGIVDSLAAAQQKIRYC